MKHRNEMMGAMGREATLRILKDGVDPENPNIVDRNLDAAMSAEYGHQMEAVEILKQTGKTDEDPEVVALMEKAAESFDFAKDREELITNIRAMMEGSAAEDVELNNFFTNADEKKINHWLLLLLTDIQTMFGDDRHDRILDIYTLGSLEIKTSSIACSSGMVMILVLMRRQSSMLQCLHLEIVIILRQVRRSQRRVFGIGYLTRA